MTEPNLATGHAAEPSGQFALLGQRRFAPFFWTQFAGAANDNLFKFALTVMVTYQLQLGWLPPSLAGLVIGALFILPYLLFSATAGGLMTQDRELTAELIGPYFELLEQVWRERSIGMASRFVRDLYPSPDHGQPLLEAARSWLEEHRQAPGALRRLVIENTENLERALRIRAGRAG